MATSTVRRNARPSFTSGAARTPGESANPGLWRDLRIAWVTAFGFTGSTVHDVARKHNAGMLNITPAATWNVLNGRRCLKFTGTASQRIGIAKQIHTTGADMAISHWLFCPSLPGTQAVGPNGNDLNSFGVRATSAGELRYYSGGSSNRTIFPNGTITTGEWQHFVGSFSAASSIWTVYRNGQQLSPSSNNASPPSTTTSTNIVDRPFATWDYTQCSMADVFIWGRQVTASEARLLYADPAAPFRRRPIVLGAAAAPPANPSGSATITTGAATPTGAGTFTTLHTGTSAVTTGAATAAASGTFSGAAPPPATRTANVIKRGWTPSIKSGYARSASESANPGLWRGLTFAFNAQVSSGGQTIVDLARGTLHFDADATYGVNTHGRALIANGTNTRVDIENVDRGITKNGQASIFAQVQVAAGSTSQGFIDVSNAAKTTNTGIFLGYETTKVKMRANTSFGDLEYTISREDVDTVGGVVDDIADSHEFWVNGVSRATGSQTGELVNAPLMNVRLCSLWQNVWPLNGSLNCAYLWNRVLTGAEMRLLHEDPLAPFRLRSQVITGNAAAPASEFAGTGIITPAPADFEGSGTFSGLPSPDLWKGFFCGDDFLFIPGTYSLFPPGGGTPGGGMPGRSDTWDDEEVWWQAFLCKAAGASVGIAPTISIDNDPISGTSLKWTLSPDIGSENVITGKWHDPDNDLVTPAQFRIFINDEDRTHEGTFDTGGSPFASTQLSWSWSSQLFRMNDDLTELRVQITDDGSNIVSAARTLEYPYIDPLRTLTGHPRGRSSLWTFVPSPPSFDLDGAHFGSTWVENATTGWIGGLQIDTEYSIEFTASDAAGTSGVWRPQFRILIPDTTTILEVLVVVNGDTGNPFDQWLEQGPQTHDDLPAPDDVNIKLISDLTLVDGDHVKITFKPIAAPSGRWPWWEFSDIRQITVSGPPPTEVEFWSWTAGEITQGDWNAYVATLPDGVNRKTGSNNIRHTFNTLATHQPYRIHVGQGDEVPEMLASGILRCRRDQVPREDEHAMVVASSAYAAWTDAFYLRPNRDYRIEFGLRLEDPPAFSYWVDDPFKIFFQFHPGAYGGSWTGATNPPIALQIYNNRFELRVRGSNQTTPQFVTHQSTDAWPLALGHHDFKIETRFDYTGATGYCNLYMDGQIRAARSGPVGINHSAASVPNAMAPFLGAYTFADGAIVQLDYYKITEVL